MKDFSDDDDDGVELVVVLADQKIPCHGSWDNDLA